MTQFNDQQVMAMSLEEVIAAFKQMKLKYLKYNDETGKLSFEEAGYHQLCIRIHESFMPINSPLSVIFGSLVRMYEDSGDAVDALLEHISDLTNHLKIGYILHDEESPELSSLPPEELAAWVGGMTKDDFKYNEEHDRIDFTDDDNADDQALLECWNENGPEHLVWALNSAVRARDAIEVQFMDFMDMVGVPLEGQVDLGAKLDSALSYGFTRFP